MAPPPRRVLISGASGLVGRAVTAAFETEGTVVTRLVRRPADAGPGRPFCDPRKGVLAADAFDGIDAVLNLSGESIADGRWTAARKQALLRSRVDTTSLIAHRLAALDRPPPVWISASAIGIYGDRGDQACDERAAAGEGFLADLCGAWEAATRPAAQAGVRVVHLRIGIVLAAEGGALARMLPIYRAGLGGKLGDGQQWFSWIALADLVRAIGHIFVTDAMTGPVNAVAPTPVRNAELSATLGRLLGRPAFMRVPAAMLRLGLGELSTELLGGVRVVPRALLDSGFVFVAPTLEACLAPLLGRI